MSPPSADLDRRGSGTVLYYAAETDERLGSFHDDILTGIEEANEGGDPNGADKLRNLWLDYFEEKLGSLTSGQLLKYLETRPVWRKYEEWPVFKTAETPCIAYTAQVDSADESVKLIAVGACYKYPSGDDDIWWQSVILPRIRSL